MANEIIETLENIEDGIKCNIAISSKGGYNVVFIDTDSNQMIASIVNMKTIESARNKAKVLLNN